MFNKQIIVHLSIVLILIASFIGIPVVVSAGSGYATGLIEAQERDPLIFDAELYAELHKVTIDEALLRLELQNIIGDMDAEITQKEADTFAGLWIEHMPEFKVVVLFTQKGNDTIKKYLPEELVEITEVRTAEKTLVELQGIQKEISSSLSDQGIPADLYTDIYKNCVMVYITDSDYARYNECLAEGKIIAPEKVIIEFVEELAQPTTAIYGGLTLSTCTSGFSVEDALGNKGVTTAGHCNNSQSWNGYQLVFEEEEFEGSCDIQWHTHANLDVENIIQDWSDGSTREIKSARYRAQQSIGSYVAKYGRTTHWTAGYIVSKTYEPTYMPNVEPTFMVFDNTFGYDILVDQGDSGSPCFDSYYAYGTISGKTPAGYAIYMAIDYLSGIGVSLLTD